MDIERAIQPVCRPLSAEKEFAFVVETFITPDNGAFQTQGYLCINMHGEWFASTRVAYHGPPLEVGVTLMASWPP